MLSGRAYLQADTIFSSLEGQATGTLEWQVLSLGLTWNDSFLKD